MRDYYFGTMEFGKATIGTHEFEICLIHEIDEVKQFETMEEAEEYAQKNGTGDYIVSAHDSIEIVFSESCLWNGSINTGVLNHD
jgi:tRNA A37 threonylcarbamoyladenosine dehydratase